MTQPSPEELAIFLKKIRSGEDPAALLDDRRPTTFFSRVSCTATQAAELAATANRPPAGLILYKFGSRSIVGSHVLTDGLPVVLKYYFPKRIYKHITYGITGSRCHQSWIAAMAFRHAGLPTPAALVIVEWRLLGGLWLDKSFLATLQAPGISLLEWVQRHADEPNRLLGMADQLRDIFSRMARYRIAHGDLKATNLLVAADDSLSLVDLDAAIILSPSGRWPSLRERDARIFNDNWDHHSTAAAAFANVFSDSASR